MRWGRFLVLMAGLSSHTTYANVVGADTQNFNPITNGLDFVTVHSSETLKPGLLNLGFFLNYAVNSLPNYENTTTQSRTNFRDSLVSADLNFGYGIMDNWDLGFSVPYLVNQNVDSDLTTFRGEYAQTGLTEFRANTKYRVTGDDSGGVALIASVNLNQIEDNPFTGINPGPTMNFEVAADSTYNKINYGANVGYRIRNPGQQVAALQGVVEPMKNQLIASAAVSYLLEEYDTKLIAEIFGGFPTEKSDFSSDRDQSSFELLGGIKTDLSQDLAFHLGAGTEIMHGTSSPDWRLYTGINWVFGPLFSEGPKEVIVRVQENIEITEEDPFAQKPQSNESFIARDVLFKFNSERIDGAFRESLNRMADYLMRPPGFKTLVIVGHTDSIGSDAYNMDLSQRRANSVRSVLIEFGVPAAKISARGMGERQPVADNGNFQGRALNRRVEFQLAR